MEWSFPFLQVSPAVRLCHRGHDGVGDPYAEILSNYPLVWLALAAPLVWRSRPVEVVSVLRWFVAALVLVLFMICAI